LILSGWVLSKWSSLRAGQPRSAINVDLSFGSDEGQQEAWWELQIWGHRLWSSGGGICIVLMPVRIAFFFQSVINLIQAISLLNRSGQRHGKYGLSAPMRPFRALARGRAEKRASPGGCFCLGDGSINPAALRCATSALRPDPDQQTARAGWVLLQATAAKLMPASGPVR